MILISLNAQTLTQNIAGQITDRNTHLPLAGAVVQVVNTDKGAYADSEGYFRITGVPVGRQTVVVSYLGYKEVMIANLWLTSAKEEILNIEMEEAFLESKEIVISGIGTSASDKARAQNEIATVSARTFSMEETNRYAGSLSDPGRMASNYAGVVGNNDQLNAVVVRGNSPTGVLWRLEGIEISNPSHFSLFVNYGGFFNILNSNVLGNSDFMTGAFPAEYGNKTGAVFDMKLKNGNFEKREYTAQVGINGMELGAEGPLSKKNRQSYIAFYRIFNFEPVKKLGINLKIGGLPAYQDINFKLNLPTQKFGKFTVFGIGGLSKISILDSERDSADWNFQTGGRDVYYTSNKGIAGASHQLTLGEKSYSKVVVAAAGTFTNSDLEILEPGKEPRLAEKITGKEMNLTARYEFGHKLNARHFFKAGGFYTFTDYRFTQNDSLAQSYRSFIRKPHFIQAFFHWQYKISRKLTLNSGIYGQYYTLGNAFSPEPRVALQYELSPRHRFAAGYGLHSQTQAFLSYQSEFNQNLGFTKSHHFVMSYDFFPKGDWRIKSEVYYQALFDLPVSPQFFYYSSANLGESFDFGLPDTLVNQGKGYNYGLELTLEKFFSGGYYFLTTLSLYDSRFRGYDGVWRNTAFNTRYAFNILGGYEWKLGRSKQNAISFDTKFSVVGGRPEIPVNLAASQAINQEVREYDKAYTVRGKTFNRWDAKLSYRLNRPKTTHFLFAGCNNILDFKNELSKYYDPLTQKIQSNYMLGIFPYGGYKILF